MVGSFLSSPSSSKPTSLEGWLNYFDLGQRGRVHLGLDRVREAAQVLNLLPLAYPSVIVGGTNGKGSTSTGIAKALEQAGYAVGLYTSPHVFQYNERMVINSQAVSDQALCQAFSQIDAACSHIFLSYFEVGLLACLIIFKQAGVQVGVFEVGLGGRLDAVNIIDPQVSVITTIHFDHMAFLGDSLEKIAFEKAGIMRAGQPVIFGGDPVPQAIHEQARQLGAPLLIYGQDFTVKESEGERIFSSPNLQIKALPKSAMHPSNLGSAIMALQALDPWIRMPSPDSIQKTFANLQVKGRYYRVQRSCPWIFDVAHNPQAVEYLIERVKWEPVSGKIMVLFCCMADKNITGMMQIFCQAVHEVYLVPLKIPRAATVEQLKAAFDQGQEQYPKTQARVFNDLSHALAKAEQAQASDLVLVFGSFYLLEEVGRALGLKLEN